MEQPLAKWMATWSGNAGCPMWSVLFIDYGTIGLVILLPGKVSFYKKDLSEVHLVCLTTSDSAIEGFLPNTHSASPTLLRDYQKLGVWGGTQTFE